MGRYFLDTSTLVKLYHLEQGTDIVDAIFAEIGSSFVISRLGIVEATSALALKVRNGELPPDDYSVTRKKLLGEVAHGTLKVMRLLLGRYRNAEKLIDRYAMSRRLRTLDALQPSIGLDLQRQRGIDIFVCADQSLMRDCRDGRFGDGESNHQAVSFNVLSRCAFNDRECAAIARQRLISGSSFRFICGGT